MSYSVNFYLDQSISKKRINEINNLNDVALTKDLDRIINNTTRQIFLYLRFSGRQVKVFTERKCTQKQWDASKQRINARHYHQGAIQVNDYLEKLSRATSKLHESNLFHKTNTGKDQIKNLVYKCNHKEFDGQVMPTFIEAYDQFLSEGATTKSKATTVIYRTCLKRFIGFSRKSAIPLDFERIDFNFEAKFRMYLIKDCGYSNNTISKTIKTLKTFLNYCSDREYNTKFTYKRFKASEKPGEVYVLTLKELMHLYKFEFNNEKLEKARDMFCFSCFTGLRYGDVASMRSEQISEGYIIKIAQKTKQRMMIPLNPQAKEILERYKTYPTPIPIIDSQKMNKYLKEIGQIVQLTSPVLKIYNSGGIYKEEYVPKWKVLTFHLGRKTFITNSLVLGLSETETKRISGHKKDESFQRYVNLADSFLKERVNEVWDI